MTTIQQIPKPGKSVIKWLLDSDPSIRWQVMRDITKEPDEVVAAERARVAREGWGAQLLTLQAPDGSWWSERDPWPWKGTILTLVMLKDLGPDPSNDEIRKAVDLIRDRIELPQLNLPFFEGETEPCINGRILATGAYFGVACDRLVDRLLSEQLEDGGWNCEAENGSVRSSFHSTICVIEGLLEYEKAGGGIGAVSEALGRANEYLLKRRMFRFLSTGEVINREWMKFSFPTTYHYDVLRGLDYLRGSGKKPDERVDEAISLVVKRQHQNGRWPLNVLHSDRMPFDMDAGKGMASRWITLRALRVLDWYSAGR